MGAHANKNREGHKVAMTDADAPSERRARNGSWQSEYGVDRGRRGTLKSPTGQHPSDGGGGPERGCQDPFVRAKRPVIFAVTLLIHVTNLDLRFFSRVSRRIGRQCPLQDGQSVSAAPPTRRTW